jgi:plastocyanin
VRVTDAAGATDEATAAVEVEAVPEAEPEAARAAEPDEPQEPEPVAKTNEPTATAAASGSVRISDFEFGPSTININAGDSVTWNNRGPTNHTATANDGSFDSGNLNRGQSYTKRFDSAGTYSYICTPHPFMTGRVVVAGAGGGSGSGGGSGGGGGGSDDAGDAGASDSGAAGSGDSGSSGDLAKTGVDLIAWSLFGFSLFAFGAALRWRLVTD